MGKSKGPRTHMQAHITESIKNEKKDFNACADENQSANTVRKVWKSSNKVGLTTPKP